MTETIHFELNGKPVSMSFESDRILLSVLRTEFGLTGTKFGCGLGFCGACTIILDNEPVRSCTVPLSSINGTKIITIEGLSKNGTLHPIQKAFIKHEALQCGYCTPAMIMTAYGLLIKNPEPSKQEIIQGMEDNLCRCGTYNRIIKAIQTAAEEMKGGMKL
jgi:aerobic-type carbon monoxide dehydrogenase small subunit (CoxS/CutS family)